MKAKQKEKAMRSVRIEVNTAMPLPVGEQVFVAGNTEQFGYWDPCAYPLTRERDNLWARTIYVPVDQAVEYKITRGSWASEELTPDDNLPANKRIDPGQEDVVAEHWIHHWKDLRMGPPPKIAGQYDKLENVTSDYLRLPRTVLVWLPPSYYEDRERSYPVIYMQDGQQVFDPSTSTWNQAWDVDEHCMKLMGSDVIREAIVVGVYCSADREREYNPELDGGQYVSFLTRELMPMIERDFRVRKGAEHTAIVGASMGATIAFFAAWKHPELFSRVGCLSPAFDYAGSTACLDLAKETDPRPSCRVFLYCGAGDRLEEQLLPGMRAMADLLRKRGFKEGADLMVIEDAEAEHTEAAWKKHTGEWLRFLLG